MLDPTFSNDLDDLNSFNSLNRVQVLIGLSRPLLLDLFFDFFEFHDVGVFVVHVEEIDLVR